MATTVAGNGVSLSPNSATVAKNRDYSRGKRRLSPNSATIAEIGDYSRQCGQGFRRRLFVGSLGPPLNPALVGYHLDVSTLLFTCGMSALYLTDYSEYAVLPA